jgi:hypothetical protein
MRADISWSNLSGALLIFKVYGQEHAVVGPNAHTAIRADVIVLDGDADETVYTNALVFPRSLQSQLKSQIGQMVLGRLGQGHAKPGQRPPWMLAAATDEDKRIGLAYVERPPSE